MAENEKTIHKQNHKAFMIWKVPQDVKQKFHAACVKQGKSMREVIVDFMRGYPSQR